MTLLRKIFFLSVLIISVMGSSVLAEEKEKIRVRAGLDLFPSILAADMNIGNKKGADGSLLLFLIYSSEKEKAAGMAKYLAKVNRVRNIPIRVEICDVQSLDQFEKRSPAGLFLTQPLTQKLDGIIDYGRTHAIIVFSPFEGDVENGVLSGIHISERLLPYINTSTMQSSKIQIKPFFLRVAVRYEE